MIFKKILILIGLQQILAESSDNDTARKYDPKAEEFCSDFYDNDENTKVKYLANGAQSIIYKCSNDNFTQPDCEPSCKPDVAALKIYFSSKDKNFTELEMIDTQLTEQGVRYPVYQWAGGIGKVEEFLSGRTDFDDDREVSSFENKTLRLAVVQKLAALHSADVEGIRKTRHMEKYEAWWNTYQVKAHFDQIEWMVGVGAFDGSYDDLYEWSNITKRGFEDEIDFVHDTLQEYYDENPMFAGNQNKGALCHNDPHRGNIMIGKDYDPETLILVDYDNVAYGYRIFDLLYFTANMNYNWTDGDVEEMLEEYRTKQTYDENLTLDKLQNEWMHHSPYFWLERMTFLVTFGFDMPEYIQELRTEYEKSLLPFNRTISSSVKVNSICWLVFCLILKLML